jgi:type I restriction enzyme R subunit
MTATPKTTDNVDTYDYFCRDEPEILIDAEDPSKGSRRQAAYEYSLGRGIEDGFLATYKVHRVRTTVDQNGLKLQEAVEQGRSFCPEMQRHENYTPRRNLNAKLLFQIVPG